jgi:hypothetical protein
VAATVPLYPLLCKTLDTQRRNWYTPAKKRSRHSLSINQNELAAEPLSSD